MIRNPASRAHWLLIAFCLIACGGSDSEDPTADTPTESAELAASAEESATALDEPEHTPSETTVAADADAPLEADDLVHGGSIEIKEYSVAFIGSGSLGKGTLRVGGAAHPFRIGGLGIGGIGVASINARGNVYNLHDLNDFPGAFGKARIGITAADKGQGRLWLKNTRGVVLELWSDMAGLALSGGVDGIAIQWEADYQRGLRDVKDSPKKAWEGTKKGARTAVDAVKRPFE